MKENWVNERLEREVVAEKATDQRLAAEEERSKNLSAAAPGAFEALVKLIEADVAAFNAAAKNRVNHVHLEGKRTGQAQNVYELHWPSKGAMGLILRLELQNAYIAYKGHNLYNVTKATDGTILLQLGPGGNVAYALIEPPTVVPIALEEVPRKLLEPLLFK